MEWVDCETDGRFDGIPLSHRRLEWEWFDVSRRRETVCGASSLRHSRTLCPESGICRQESEVRRQARCEKAWKTFGETSPAIVEPDADMLAEKSIRDDQINVVVAIDVVSSDSQTQCVVMKKEEGPGGRVTA